MKNEVIRLYVPHSDLRAGDRPWSGRVEVLRVLDRTELSTAVLLRSDEDEEEYPYTYDNSVWIWRVFGGEYPRLKDTPPPPRFSNERELAETRSKHLHEYLDARAEHYAEIRREEEER